MLRLVHVDEEIETDPRLQLIGRIVSTSPFQKSSRLPDLLRYLADRTIYGRPDELTEQRIGTAVFGKAAGYSPVEDSAVRVHVRQLRLRLHEYYDGEGRNEAVVVDIPKGAYTLVFHSPRPGFEAPPEVSPPTAVETTSPTLVEDDRKTRMTWVREGLFSLAITLALVCGFGWHHAATTGANAPLPWPVNAVVQQNKQTNVVVADSNSMLRLMGQKEFSLEEYLKPGFQQSMIPQHLDKNVFPLVDYIADSHLTSIADLLVASTLVKLAGSRSDELMLRSARDLNQRDLEQGNYVFVGSPISNPWVSLFEKDLNFEAVEEGVGGKMYFLNKKPKRGEQPTYQGLEHTGSAGEDYATISLLPNNSGSGNVMILQGLRQEGTEALGVLLGDAADRAKLKKVLGTYDDQQNPGYFEALIQARTVAGAPVSVEIIATRVIQH